MNINRITFLIFTSLLNFSCGNEVSEKQGDGKIILEKVPLAKTPYKIEKIIPLETTVDNLLKDFLLVQSNSNGYYIMDKDKEDAIHHFSLDGKYFGKILEVGEGPEMLPNIHDFIATEKGLEVLVGKGDNSEIWIYDDSYHKSKNINLDYLAFSFAKTANGDYLLSGSYNKPIVMHRFVIINPEGEKINEFLPNDYQNEVLPVGERNFNPTKKGIFFHEFYNPKLFEIMESEVVPKYELDLGKYAIPDHFWELDWMQGFELINKNGFGFVSHYFENEEKVFIGVNIQSDQQIKNHQIILEKNSDKIEKRIHSPTENPVFYHLVAMDDDHLIFAAQAADLLDLNPDILAESEINIGREDNPVLIFVKL